MKRNPNGYGSVVKLSGNRTRPYMARVTTGFNDKGYPIYKAVGYFETRVEGMKALAIYNDNPYDLNLRNITISQLWEIFKERKFDKVSQSSKYVYNAAFKNIAPLHNKKIQEIKTYHMQKLVDSIDKSWESKSHVVTLLNQLFDIALEFDVIRQNYAKHIKLEKRVQSNRHKPFTMEEIEKLFSFADQYEWIDTILILIFTGMRPSELLNIENENVFLDKSYMIGGMKTDAGRDRIIPINFKIYNIIKKRYNPQNKYLIQEKPNKHMSYNSYRLHFDDIMKKLEMDHLPHDGRHTFASLMDTAGANQIATKRIMGHANTDITGKIYTHKAVDELLKNANMI